MRCTGSTRWFLCLTLILLFIGNVFAEPVSTQNSIPPQESKQIVKESFPITAPTTIGRWFETSTPVTDEIDVPITIGTGTTQQAYPVFDYWHQTISAGLYTAAQIQAAGGAAGIITHLRWDCGTPSTWIARQIWIYIRTTTETTLTGQTWSAFQAAGPLNEVYNSVSQIYTGPATTGWQEWDINDFTWNGTDNLIFVMRSYRPGYQTNTTPWKYTATTTNQHLYWYGDTADLTTYTGLVNTYLPNLQMEMIIAPGSPFGPIPPNASTNVPTNATLSWVAGTNSSTFDVYFGTTNPPTAQVATGQAGTSWTPPALAATTTYYWYVRAFNNWGNTTGPVWSFTTGTGIAPNAPTNGAIVSVTTNSITTSFTDNATNETGFPVFVSTNGVDYTLSQTLPPNPSTGTVQFTLTTLSPNTQYWIRVFVAGTGGTSTGFAAGNAWTLANPAASIVLGAVGFTNVFVASIPADGNPTNTMYRVMVNPGVYVLAGGIPLTQLASLWTNYNVTGLNSGTTYNFRAVAVNGAGVEAPGPIVPVTTSDANSAGPDAFGYRYLNHMAPNGPAFNWITPGGTTIPTTTGWTSTDDGFYTTPQSLGFTFNWYGVDYSQLYLCSNGYVTFDAGYSTLGPSLITTQPGAGILFWGRDMHVGYTAPTTDITIQTLGTQPNRYCVITFISLAQFATAANRMDAQIIIYENGQVKVQYNNVNAALPRGVVGIKALNGANGMNLEYAPALTPSNGTAILYYRLGVPTDPIPANNASNVPLGTNLQWTAAPAATGYNVFYGTTNPPPQVSTNQAGTTYVVTLAPTTTYYWQVVAIGTGGTTNAGPVWNFATGTGAAPIAPTNGVVTNPTTSSLMLGWSDNSNDETGFPVYRSLDALTYTLLTTTGANASSYTDNNLTPSMRYFYRVYAQNANATSLSFANMNGVTLPTPAGTLYISLRGAGWTTAGVDSIGSDFNSSQATYKIEVMGLGFIQSDGSVGPTPRVVSRSGWNNFNIINLVTNTTYQMRAIAVSPANQEAPGFTSSITTNDSNVGGPDGFGYRFINSNAVGGPSIADWVEIAGTAGGPGTNTGLTGDDQNLAVSMGTFQFPFYGTTYTGNINICTNGWAGFNTTSAAYYNDLYPLPTTIFTTPVLLLWWDDLYPPSGGSIWYFHDEPNNRFIIEWYQVPHISSSTTLMTMQMQLYGTGEIKYRYLTIGTLNNSSTIGIQGPTSGTNNNYLQYSHILPVTSPLAVDFYRLGIPSNPLPPDGATAVPTNTTLTWNSGRAATGYDVFFGTANPPTTQVANNQTDTTFTPTLAASTTYYWRVVSRLGTLSTSSPVWSFTTGTGPAPAAPTGGNITNVAPTSLRMNWVDNSNNETGFRIRRSTNGTNFDSIATTAANVVLFNSTGLIPNTQYFYRVYSFNANAMSINFASANNFTLAAVPAAPSIVGVGITTVGITVNNNATSPNSANTQYAIRVGTQFVQSNGFLGASEVWRSLAQWGTVVSVGGLTAGNTYEVSVKARNQNQLETAYSATASFTSSGAFQLPLTQNFETATFPPPDWTVFNREPGTTTWTRYTDASGGMARVNFWSYSASNHVDLLWSPPISTVGAAAVRVEWNWYYQDGSGYNDTVEVVYSLNGGTDWTRLWLRRGQGTGEEDLGTGTNGTVVSPGAFPTGWGHAEIFLPTAALNHPSILIGWLGRTNYGPDIFIDNIMVTVTGPAYLEGWVYQSNATPMADVNVQVRTQWTATTDMSGRWFIEIPAGVYPVRVWKPCWFPNPTLHDSVIILVGDTVRFVDTLYTPHMTASTNELSFIVPPGQIMSQTLTLGNTGDWPYNFQARFRRNPQVDNTRSNVDVKLYARVVEPAMARFGPTDPNRRLPDRNSDFDPAVREPLNGSFAEKRAYEEWHASQQPTTPPVIDQTWGPDGYGYESYDNLELQYPTTVEYLDIRTFTTTPVATGDDAGAFVGFPTNFSFNFYGTTFSGVWATTNGNIQFRNAGTGSNGFSNTILPATGMTNAAFALWDDLFGPVFTYYDNSSNIFYAQWNVVRLGYPDSLHFQIQLHGDNHGIVFVYNLMNNISILTETVGIQGGTGANNYYIQNYFNTRPAQYTGYGIAFADMSAGGGGGWGGREYTFLVNPETGTVFPSQPMELFLQVTAEDSASIGFISTGNLFIRTNTCDSLTIPITVEISLGTQDPVTMGLPMEYKLHQNFPNPFNPSTEIRFDLPKDGMTKLSVYNMLGQKVADLVNQPLSAGYQTVRFDASRLAAGVYFYRLESGNFTSMKKMVLVK